MHFVSRVHLGPAQRPGVHWRIVSAPDFSYEEECLVYFERFLGLADTAPLISSDPIKMHPCDITWNKAGPMCMYCRAQYAIAPLVRFAVLVSTYLMSGNHQANKACSRVHFLVRAWEWGLGVRLQCSWRPPYRMPQYNEYQ